MGKYRITLDGKTYEMEVERIDGAAPAPAARVPSAPAVTAAAVKGEPVSRPTAAQPAGGNAVASPMPGTILKVYVAAGDAVKKGQPVLVLEAMKMENEIVSPRDGHVSALHVAQGNSVQGGEQLFEIGD